MDKLDGNKPSALSIRWARFYPTRPRLWLIFIGHGVLALIIAAAMYAAALAGNSGIMIGGDFSAFYVAAQAAQSGEATAVYDVGAFQANMGDAFPGRDDLNLSWQYPPTYFLAIAIFAGMPYLVAFTLFSGMTASAYAWLLRRETTDRLVFFGVMASPAAFNAFITGQNGFLNAAFVFLAAFDPKRRPIMAGIAAGLLTMKPHLGLLIPIAYLAAGCWRAIIIAALTAATLATLSVGAYGTEPWLAFLAAVGGVADRVSDATMPLAKMTTPYSAALFAGLPDMLAKMIHGVFAIGTIAITWRVWRRVSDPMLRAAILIASVFLIAPYGFYYELIILGLPIALIAHRALQTGWVAHEKTLLAIIWASTMAAPFFAEMRHGVSPGFFTVALAFGLVLRRLHFEQPDLLPWQAPSRAEDGAAQTA